MIVNSPVLLDKALRENEKDGLPISRTMPVLLVIPVDRALIR